MSNGDQFTNPIAPPDTVVVADLVASESDPRKKAQLETLGKQDAGEAPSFFSALWAGLLDGIGTVGTAAVLLFDPLMLIAGRFFKSAQGENNRVFYDLAASVLEDLTGVPVDANALKNSTFGSGRLAGMQTFGADLYNLLESEFKPESGNLENPDSAPAQRFLGFLMNFAVRQGNMAVLSEFIPDEANFMKGYREYGELMAKNLGLGRMAARAFRPLPQLLVADPLTAKLNAQYRPKRMAKEQAIKAFFRKAMTETELRKELAEEGFSDGRQNLIIFDSRPILTDREIIRLYFRGFYSTADMTQELTMRGWTENDIPAVLEAERPQLLLSDILELYLYSGTTVEDTATALGKLGYDVTTAGLIIEAFTMRHDPTKRTQPLRTRTRTFFQLRKEYIDGVINLVEWNDQLTQLGYGVDDIAAMTQDLLIDASKGKTTASKRAIPSLSWAQLKAAYKAGVLDLEEVQVHLIHRGYSADDIAVLLKELPAQPAPPAA